ncbi:hypothetical protein ACIP29_27815 [Streptomyces coelicoflavus]|uniref:hypothetical protein n=1 Tax=Streptomyces coelicoflavus TaxID=285562 RepID=UPI00382E64CE
MSISLRRLLASTPWSGSVSVLAGAEVLDRAVHTVSAVATVDPPGPFHEGELLVLAQSLPLDDWRVDVLLRRIADASGAGLVLPGLEPLRSTLRLAALLEVPLLGTTDAPLDLCVSARTLLALPELDGARLVLDTHRALGNRVYAPEVVVATFRDIVDAPVAFLDHRGEPLAGRLSAGEPRPGPLPVPSRTPHGRGLVLVSPFPRPVRTGPVSGSPSTFRPARCAAPTPSPRHSTWRPARSSAGCSPTGSTWNGTPGRAAPSSATCCS